MCNLKKHNYASLFCSVLISMLVKHVVAAQYQTCPVLDFHRCSEVRPILHHGKTKREISSTRDVSGTHYSHVQVTIPVEDERLILNLHLQEDLIAGDYMLQYQESGKTVQKKPDKHELCHYSGTVKGKAGSWASVSTCHGIEGVVFDGQTMRYIKSNPSLGGQSHYIIDHKNFNTNYNFDQSESFYNDTRKDRIVRNKRETNAAVRGPYKSNRESRYIELVLVADHGEFQANGGSLPAVQTQMIQLANVVNSLYSPLNIYITLVGVVVWNERDEINMVKDGDITLANFLAYRRNKLNLPNDNAHLITQHRFNNGIVGKAIIGPICTAEFSGGITTNHSSVIGVVATTVAHGLGHNFGFTHDDENCSCPDEKCIMSSSISSVVPVHWSTCSLHSLDQSFNRGMDYCLRNKPKSLFNSPICGNGFVEPGEQCDSDNICCDPETCKLRSNATCATGNCCDLTTCLLKPLSVQCRSVDGECDLPEFYTGKSEFCPTDVYKMDSTPCKDKSNEAYCVQGACRSHTGQCQLLWGITGETSHNKCYSHNAAGSRHGNCGYDRINQTYKPCASGDEFCGRLQCNHQNASLEFGLESVTSLRALFLWNNGKILPCHTAIIDVGQNDVDPGLVPDGAKCGDDRMCLKQRCVAVDTVRDTIKNRKSSVCPSDCSGHGVCNSEGHCHCDQGYAPPLCVEPGPGGSVDSGPATDLVRISHLKIRKTDNQAPNDDTTQQNEHFLLSSGLLFDIIN